MLSYNVKSFHLLDCTFFFRPFSFMFVCMVYSVFIECFERNFNFIDSTNEDSMLELSIRLKWNAIKMMMKKKIDKNWTNFVTDNLHLPINVSFYAYNIIITLLICSSECVYIINILECVCIEEKNLSFFLSFLLACIVCLSFWCARLYLMPWLLNTC